MYHSACSSDSSTKERAAAKPGRSFPESGRAALSRYSGGPGTRLVFRELDDVEHALEGAPRTLEHEPDRVAGLAGSD